MNEKNLLLEVFRSRFDTIVEEMQNTLIRNSFSIILKEGGDCSCSLLTAGGEILAQSTAQPTHLAAFVPAMQHILRKFPLDSMAPDDIYLLNDPYSGGTHLPDIILIGPIFSSDRIVGFGCALSHHQDVGGLTPGSMVPNAEHVLHEGLAIPPVKFHDRGVVNRTVLDIIERNVRVPEQVLGDLAAQVSAVRTCGRRVAELIDKYGMEIYDDIVVALLDHSEQLTRQRLSQIPDGTYEFEDYLDGDGRDFTKRLKLRVAVTISGSGIEFDFEGTSPQSIGSANTAPEAVLGPVYYAVRAITDPSIPSNAGCFRPVTVHVAEGTLLRPRWPAPVSIRYHTLKRCVDAIMGALAPAMPDRIPAAPHGSDLVASIGGVDPKTSSPYVYMESTTGGTGGTWHRDGVSSLGCDLGNGILIPAEATELEYPFRIRTNLLRTDSAGAGRYRGGFGVIRVIELLRGTATASMRGDRHFTQPWGLSGGAPGARWVTAVRRADGEMTVVPGRAVFDMNAGDQLIVLSGAGGGYGPPRERPAEEVAADVREGIISADAAFTEYGVVLRPDLSADLARTAEMRQKWLPSPADATGAVARGTDGMATTASIASELAAAEGTR
jgi:N-methylhydantoinase B